MMVEGVVYGCAGRDGSVRVRRDGGQSCGQRLG